MSLNSRYRERKYNTSDNDRLLRALSQPVQAWDKKWALHLNSKTFQTYKWVKSERQIEFEQDEESEPEADLVETTQDISNETKDANMEEAAKIEPETTVNNGPVINKAIDAIQQEQEDDEKRSHTPKLDDISDEEPEPSLDNEDEDNDADNINDPSKHPAFAPHAQAHMTDDDLMTNSAAATPNTFTENNTPMPSNAEDETMEDVTENKANTLQ
ncbi:unnamed protein product [Rhizopus microsporus]